MLMNACKFAQNGQILNTFYVNYNARLVTSLAIYC